MARRSPRWTLPREPRRARRLPCTTRRAPARKWRTSSKSCNSRLRKSGNLQKSNQEFFWKRNPAGDFGGVSFLSASSVGGHGPSQGIGHVCVKQTVKQVLPGFAAKRKTPCDVSTGRQPPLDRIADRHVF